jgi:hypothetical protein
MLKVVIKKNSPPGSPFQKKELCDVAYMTRSE